MRKIAIFAISIVISFFVISSLYAQRKPMERVRIGNPASQSLNFLPSEIAIRNGYYSSQAIDLEIFVMRGVTIDAALRSGDVDFSGRATSIRGAAAGLPFKMVMCIGDKLVQRLVARPEIKTFKDLKGKTIGVGSVGGATAFLAQQIVKHYGLDPQKDITIVGAGAGMKFPALLAGSVDAAMLDSQETIRVRKKGFNELARAVDVYLLPSIALTTTDRHIRERREMVKKVIRGTLKGLLYIRENKEESVAHMIKEWGYDKEIAPIYYDMEIEATTKDGKPAEKAILNEIEAARVAGMIKESVPLSKVADFSILQEVQKELGLIR